MQEHKPLVDKLNKTGSALTKLCKDEESDKLEIILESDNSRYNALRKILREHQSALEEALQATSQVSIYTHKDIIVALLAIYFCYF